MFGSAYVLGTELDFSFISPSYSDTPLQYEEGRVSHITYVWARTYMYKILYYTIPAG